MPMTRAPLRRNGDSVVDEIFDIIIVGSGPVGSAFARTVADLSPDARMLMLEVGPQVSTPAGRHVRRLVDPRESQRAQVASQGPVRGPLGLPPARALGSDADRRLPVGIRPGTFLLSDGMLASDSRGFPAGAMSSNVGGMGAHWSCACPAPGSSELIPFLPADQFASALADSYRLLHVTQHAFDGSELAAGVLGALQARFDPRLPEGRGVQAMPLSLPPDADGVLGLGGTDTILGDLLTEESTRFTLRPDTLVTSLIRSGDRVVGVRTRSMIDGSEAVIHAGIVYVAADSLRTPQLLHASGIRPDALGRYLNDHLDVRCFVRLHDDFRDLPRGVSEADRGGLARDAGVVWMPFLEDVFPFSVQVMQIDASPIALDESTAPWPGSYIGVVVFGGKDLSPDDRVRFSDTETDAYGMPALKVEHALSARDHETYGRMFQVEDEIARTLGTYVSEAAALQEGGSYHYMGTIRMGEHDDGRSVVDPFGAVWGVDGLWLGGNGVIPTSTACNPTATSVALAVRSAKSVIAGS
ncbi:GMC oxidoreductase [Microbacterium sp. KHB019]|uniref:GMC oxidoreductase n=1 Tax=Microbacterium sp. KHB019 TaxID=3129770 RepID=UPI00307A9EE5